MPEPDPPTASPPCRDAPDPAPPPRPVSRFGRTTLIGSANYVGLASLLIVLICVSVVALFPAGPVRAGQNWLFDTYQRLGQPERNSDPVVVVEIDEESIRHIGPWPWPRNKLAALVDRTRGAAAVGLDILFPDADRLAPDRLIDELPSTDPTLRQSLLRLPDPDAVLAAALRASPVVLAMTADNNPAAGPPPPVAVTPIRQRGDGIAGSLPSADAATWPLTSLAEAARGVGFVSASRTRSGQIDRLPSAIIADGTIMPGFGLQLLTVARNANTVLLTAHHGHLSSVSVDGFPIRTDPTGEIRPRFIGPGRILRIPAHRLLEEPGAPARLRGKIVVIGVTAPGAAETFRVPLGLQESSPALQAELIASVLARDTLWRPAWAIDIEAATAAIASLTVLLLLGRVRYRYYVLSFCGIAALLAAGSVILFRTEGILLDCILPLSCLFTTGFVSTSLRIGAEMAARRQREAELAVVQIRQSAERREAALQSEANALRQSLAFAVDAAGLGVWDADLRTGSWHHSPRHDAILSLEAPPPRWSPAVLLDRVVPEDLDTAIGHFATAETSGTLQFECRISWPDGSLHYIHVLGRFWQDTNGIPSRVAGVVADITQRRTLEQRLHQSEKMQAIGLLAGGIAHNFNNLLTVVLGSLDLARSRLGPSSRAAPLIEGATTASQKCAVMARQLLAFARLQPLVPKPTDPIDLLRGATEMIRSALPDRIAMTMQIPPHLGAVNIDPLEFELALLNLAVNARDAMPDGGKLTIIADARQQRDDRLGLDGRYLTVEVADTGQGIPPDKLPRVFEPFFTTKEVGQGTGLGLSQVHGFAHQSGGAVEIDSTPGLGTRVRLYLPLLDGPSHVVAAHSARPLGMEISR